MTFLNPLFFWSFLSLVPLAAIYLLKVRPRRKPTTAFFLWEEIFRERRPNRLLQRLRDVWSLLLMALAFAAVCLALTGPEVTDDDRKDVLLLIDNSASMNTLESGQSRLERAKKTAADILRAFNGTQRAAVATVSNQVRYRAHLSDNPRELLDAVDAVEPTDFQFRADQLQANAQQGDWLEQQRVVLISDGCFDVAALPERVELLKVGGAAENIGLIAADLRRIPGGTDRLGLYFQVSSTHSSSVQADLLVYQGADTSNLFRLIPLEIEPGANEPQVFPLENAPAGAWTIRLDVDDALPNDNVSYLSVPPAQPVRVQVVSSDRFFFENSVLAFSRGSGLLELVTERPDIVITKSEQPDAERAIIFQPAGESRWWSDLGELVDDVAPRLLVDDHPILRHIDVPTLGFVGAIQLSVPDHAQVLVASDNGIPLIYRVTEGGRTAVVVNMDPVAAEFYFSAWFPVLVHGAATHLVGRHENPLSVYRPGENIPIPGLGDGGTTTIEVPRGESFETTDDTFGPAEEVGLYRIKNDAGEWTVATSLLSRQESNVDNEHVTDTSEPISQGWPISQLLTLGAVVALAVESLLYHRRKVG